MRYCYTLLNLLILLSIFAFANGQSYTSGYPNITDVTSSGGRAVTNTTSNDYDTYYIIQSDGVAAPTIRQVKRGEDGTGTAAVVSGSFWGSASGTEFFENFTGLNSSTNYDAYFVTYDWNTATDIETTTPTLVSFITASAPPAITSYLPLQDAVDVALDDALTLTFDKDIQFGAGPQVIRIRRVS
ncbi:hypothetical protein KDU71_15335, partial [Carboxylicivirga sediminis]|nr:hypothetical protein [Carboxylicivirga sediminis]